jgi:hypothetical protein
MNLAVLALAASTFSPALSAPTQYRYGNYYLSPDLSDKWNLYPRARRVNSDSAVDARSDGTGRPFLKVDTASNPSNPSSNPGSSNPSPHFGSYFGSSNHGSPNHSHPPSDSESPPLTPATSVSSDGVDLPSPPPNSAAGSPIELPVILPSDFNSMAGFHSPVHPPSTPSPASDD